MVQDAHGGVAGLNRGSLQPVGGTDGSALGNPWHRLWAAPGTLEHFDGPFVISLK